jgi:hypothetical protein
MEWLDPEWDHELSQTINDIPDRDFDAGLQKLRQV